MGPQFKYANYVDARSCWRPRAKRINSWRNAIHQFGFTGDNLITLQQTISLIEAIKQKVEGCPEGDQVAGNLSLSVATLEIFTIRWLLEDPKETI